MFVILGKQVVVIQSEIRVVTRFLSSRRSIEDDGTFISKGNMTTTNFSSLQLPDGEIALDEQT